MDPILGGGYARPSLDAIANPEYLGLEGELSKTQISDKLRRAACTFVREHLQYDILSKMKENGINTNKNRDISIPHYSAFP